MKRSVSILLTVCLILSVLTNSALAVDVAGDSKNGQTTESSEAAQTGLATGKGEEWQEILDDQKIAEQENGISPQADEILVTDHYYYSSTSPEIKVNADPSCSWVGLYPASTTSYGTSIAWYSCSGVSGYVNLKTSNIVKWNLTAWGMDDWSLSGAYKVVLFGDSGYTNVLATRYVFVGTVTLKTDKDEYLICEPIYVTTNYAQFEGWVGMRKSNVTAGAGAAVAWYYPMYVNSADPGLTLTNANLMGNHSLANHYPHGKSAIVPGTYVISVYEHDFGATAYNEIKTKTITIKDHNYSRKNTSSTYLKSAATCTKAAVYYYSCTCGAKGTSTFESGNPIAHTYNQKNTSETYLKSSATCTSAAVYYYSCTCGAKGTSTFTSGNALGHSWTNATCTTAKTCSRCKTTEGSALGHTPSTVGAVAATCSAPGYTGDSVCSVCQVTLSTGSAIPVLPHTETVINASAATCTDPGYTGDTVCSVCDAQIAAGTEIAAKGHTEALENAVAADCENPGYTGDTVCTVCGETLEEGESIEALGHDYVSSVTPPTCTEDGYTTHTCSRDSSHTYRDTEVPAKGHVWGPYQVIKPATHEEAGIKRRVCTECDATGSQILTILKLPRVDLQLEAYNGRLVLTGIYDDYANKYTYQRELRFGIVLVPTGSLSGELSLNTAGRTKIEFSEFKNDGTFRYFFKPAGDEVSYSARAFVSYPDPATGEEVILYSDILEGSYTACEGRTLTTVPAQAD